MSKEKIIDNPHPIKLGELKEPLKEYANKNDRSLHKVIIMALRAFCINEGLIKEKSSF